MAKKRLKLIEDEGFVPANSDDILDDEEMVEGSMCCPRGEEGVPGIVDAVECNCDTECDCDPDCECGPDCECEKCKTEAVVEVEVKEDGL